MKSHHSRELTIAFLLGLQLEELYSVFGEGLIRIFQYASKDYVDAFYNKFVLITESMRELDLGNEFEAVDSFIRNEVSSIISSKWEDQPTIKAHFDAARAISTKLDVFMNNVAAKLNSVDKTRFDLGIFIARISLCCRVIKGRDDKKRALYVKELERIKENYLAIVQKGKESGVVEAAFNAIIRSRFESIATEMKNLDFQTPWVVAAIHTQIEPLLDDMGFSFGARAK